MTRFASAIFAALLLSYGVPAFADCGSDLVAIDERLAVMELAPESREEVERLRAAGAVSCDAGDEATARSLLAPAEFLLGLLAVSVEE